LIDRLKSKAYGDAPLNVNEDVWKAVRDGERAKERIKEGGVELEDEESEAEEENELDVEYVEADDDEEEDYGGREFVSDDSAIESDGVDDLEDLGGETSEDDSEDSDGESKKPAKAGTKRKAKPPPKRPAKRPKKGEVALFALCCLYLLTVRRRCSCGGGNGGRDRPAYKRDFIVMVKCITNAHSSCTSNRGDLQCYSLNHNYFFGGDFESIRTASLEKT